MNFHKAWNWLALASVAMLVGCGARSPADHGRSVPRLKILLSKTDALYFVDRYKSSDFREAKKPDDVSEPYKIRTIFSPGFVSFVPVIVTDEQKRDRSKGVNVSVQSEQWFVGGEKGGGQSRDFVLDEDEMTDMLKSLDMIGSTAAKWSSQTPDHFSSETFETKDGLNLSLESITTGPELFVGASGASGAFVKIDLARLGELKGDIARVIQALDAH